MGYICHHAIVYREAFMSWLDDQAYDDGSILHSDDDLGAGGGSVKEGETP